MARGFGGPRAHTRPAVSGGFRRRVVAMAGLLLAVLVLAPATPAQAHATLLFTTPAADGAVAQSPDDIHLVFDQAVVATGSSLELTSPRGEAFDVGQPAATDDPRVLASPVHEVLATGEYTVHWQVTAPDGDTMVGSFRFGVGSTSGLSSTPEEEQSATVRGVPALTALRTLLFAGLSLALGGLVGARHARRTRQLGGAEDVDPAPWTAPGAALGLVAGLGLALAQLGGGVLAEGIARWHQAPSLLASTPGRVLVIQVLAFATAALLAVRARRGPAPLVRQRLAGAALFVVAGAEGVRSHPEAAAPGWGAALVVVHLTAAAVWVGALVHVVRVARARRGRGVATAPVVLAYAHTAWLLFLLVALTGTANVLVLARPRGLFDTLLESEYGGWLLAKLTLVAVVAACALLARRHLARRARRQPGATVRLELVSLVGVLAVSALLTSLAPPARQDLPLPFPPPPAGPVTAVGARAGWIGVGASASEGQLVIRLRTPDAGEFGDGVEPTGRVGEVEDGYRLAANLVAPGADDGRGLEFRRCGSGCFVAPVEWTPGRHVLTLDAGALAWDGGAAALNINWPPRQSPATLRRAVRVMRKVDHFTLHEQVTSDTSAGLGDAQQLGMSGPEFLDTEPYVSGVAPSVVVTGRSDDETELALAYPAEGIYVRLLLDSRHRITRETLTAANHLVERTFVYPAERQSDGHTHEH